MDESTIQRLLALSQLALDDQAKSQISQDLDAILGFIEVMNQVPTDGVLPLAHAVELDQILRSDLASPAIDRTRLQTNAPATTDGYYLVPKVLDSQ